MLTLLLLCSFPLLTMADEASWSNELLKSRAEQLAKQPFQASPELPQQLRSLDYDSYRLIAFEHEQAIWKRSQLPFWLECFHRGYLFGDKVDLNLVQDGRAKPLVFDRRLFQYRGKLADLDLPDDLGFAGFRVLGKFESSPHMLEIASFLGASYFRAIGEGQVYGTSARGLAIDVGLAKAEEFPVFREFWIERPAQDARTLRFFALLDSASVTGAYQFELRPGKATVFDVQATLYFRRRPEKIGLGPLTSMWAWGDGHPPPAGEKRPKVHDCDGLLVATIDGQWIWRPLSRQGYPSLSHYDFASIRGFGLMQRDRDPDHFLDNEAKYHLRPSVWIEPKQGWQDGAVELLELPAPHEGIDNIAAWWMPKAPIEVGRPLHLEYTVSFMSAEPAAHTLAKATAMRVNRREDQPIRLEVDFVGDRLSQLAADAPVSPQVEVQRGEGSDIQCRKQRDGLWRLSFNVQPTGKEPLELQALLKGNDEVLTETWRYLCPILPE